MPTGGPRRALTPSDQDCCNLAAILRTVQGTSKPGGGADRPRSSWKGRSTSSMDGRTFRQVSTIALGL
jgi:hypothetical protein